MESVMKLILNILVFLLQLAGAVLVGIGFGMIWTPLGWIYSGTAVFAFGHLLYRAMESEETEK
jgi:hypothetical protein